MCCINIVQVARFSMATNKGYARLSGSIIFNVIGITNSYFSCSILIVNHPCSNTKTKM